MTTLIAPVGAEIAGPAEPGNVRRDEPRPPHAAITPTAGDSSDTARHSRSTYARSAPPSPPLSIRNVRMMRVLDRVAAKLDAAGVSVMALKGAVLQLELHDRPDLRPMDDLDLLIREKDVDRAFAVLEDMEGLRGAPLVREDFFPRYHYEMEYTVGRIYPVRIDLHVRPFRPLRYSRLVPPDALWESARRVHIDRSSILIPSVEDMLIHLSAHVAIHGFARRMWLTDVRGWAVKYRERIDWERFLASVWAWGLALPVREALGRTEREFGRIVPEHVPRRLAEMKVNWRDRLALRHAPRDSDHPAAHVAVNVLTTPGWRFTLGYLRAVFVPGKGHMADWYCGRHFGWLPCAHVVRWLRALTPRVPLRGLWLSKTETRESRIHGVGVFSTRFIKPGEVIARYHGREVDRHGTYVIPHKTADGKTRYLELTGKLKVLNHSCQANARLDGFKLVAVRPLVSGQEITIDYGHETCDCKSGLKSQSER